MVRRILNLSSIRTRMDMLIDLDKNIPKTEEYLYDSVHLNNTGSELAAIIITEHLQTLIIKDDVTVH